jgi:enamine deaminase RidA (YjgF/YER057c/UK114 family)
VANDLRSLYLPGTNLPSGLRAGDLVYLSAIAPKSKEAVATTDGIHRQTAEALECMKNALADAGASLANLARVNAYMSDAGAHREAVYDVWDEWFPDAADKPAFKILDASMPEGMLVRFDLLALAGHTRRRIDIDNVDARDPAVRIGPWLLTSRLHGTSPETGGTVEGLEAQARQTVANGIRLVELAGGSKTDVTQIVGFGRDLSYEPALKAAIAEAFGTHIPAYHGVTTFVRPVLEVMAEVTAYIND